MPTSKSIHVFTTNFLPPAGSPRGGDDRAAQIISALTKAGHQVTYSMPLSGDMPDEERAAVVDRLMPDQRWCCDHFDQPEIVLNRLQPDIAIYSGTAAFRTVRRYARDIVEIVDLTCASPLLNVDYESIQDPRKTGHAKLLETRARRVVDQLRHADYLLTVSESQKYFWLAYCSMAGFSFRELDVRICPVALAPPPAERKLSPSLSLAYAGAITRNNSVALLDTAAETLDRIPGAVFHVFAQSPGQDTGAEAKAALDQLTQHTSVRYHRFQTAGEFHRIASTCWAALHLSDHLKEAGPMDSGALRFVANGLPLIYTHSHSDLARLLAQFGAGWSLAADDPGSLLKTVISALAEGGPSLAESSSAQIRRLVAAHFDPDVCMAPLVDLCNSDVAKRSARTPYKRTPSKNGALPALGNTLVITPEPTGPIAELRLNNPLRSLQHQGFLAGFRNTDLSFSSIRNDGTPYDSILVQRTVPEYIYEVLYQLGLPFILDIDDNLLARADYRRMPAEASITTGLRYASIVTAPNPRLIRLLEKYSGLRLASKAMITPNALPFARSIQPAKRPSQLIWIQSDIAALSASREAVVRAVDDFSRKHHLPVVLIGRNVVEGAVFERQVIMGEIGFTANLQLLENAPTSIGIAPLETNADPETLDFIAGKSDLKILLFAGYGHPAVYSASPPYTDSPLQSGEMLIGNSYEAWTAALEYQLTEGWKTVADRARRIQSDRGIGRVSNESWAPAISQVLLEKPILGRDLYEAFMEALRVGRSPGSAIPFDERLALKDAEQGEPLTSFDSRMLERLDGESKLAYHRISSRITDMRHTIRNLQKEVMDLRNSLSWRITAPLRKIAKPIMERKR